MTLRNSDTFNFVGNIAAGLSSALLIVVLGLLLNMSNDIATIKEQNKNLEKRVCNIETEIKVMKPVLSDIKFLHRNELFKYNSGE